MTTEMAYLNLGGLLEAKIAVLLSEHEVTYTQLDTLLGMDVRKELRKPYLSQSFLERLAQTTNMELPQLTLAIDIERLCCSSLEVEVLDAIELLTQKLQERAEQALHNTLTVNEAIQYSGYVRKTLYSLIQSGRVRAIKKTKQWYIYRDSLDQHITTQERRRHQKTKWKQKSAKELEGWLSLREAATLLNVNRQTVRRYTERNKLEVKLYKHTLYVKRDDLASYGQDPRPPHTLTVKEACERLGIKCTSTLHWYAKQGRLRSIKKGKLRYFYEDGIEEFEQQRKTRRTVKFGKKTKHRLLLEVYFRQRPHRFIDEEELKTMFYQKGVEINWATQGKTTLRNMEVAGLLIQTVQDKPGRKIYWRWIGGLNVSDSNGDKKVQITAQYVEDKGVVIFVDDDPYWIEFQDYPQFEKVNETTAMDIIFDTADYAFWPQLDLGIRLTLREEDNRIQL